MRKLVIGLFLVMLAVLIVVVITMAAMGGFSSGVSSGTILEVNLEQNLIEYVPGDPIANAFLSDTTTVRDIVDALDSAAADERVIGLVARVGASGMGMARTQEVRDAIKRFREAGKPAVAFAETFGEFSNGTVSYYLASAFDEIWMQPSGDLAAMGLIFESMFMRGAFEKIGVEPRMDQRYEYKNAMNVYTEKKMTPAHREAMQALADSWFEQMVRGISEARGLTPEKVRSLIDSAPLLGAEAQEAGLVDQLGYRDAAYARIRELAGEEGEDGKLLYLGAYLESKGRPHTSGTDVALIFGVGGIARGQSQFDPISGSMVMGSDTVAAAIREVIKDDDIEGILFRVDCPGGSYVASDTVWHEIARAREAGKKVVISMGDLAGSGGYFVAMNSDRIVAQPGTITASIGVLAGKLLTSDMWDKTGISWDGVFTSENAHFFTGTKDYDEAEWARFQAWLDRIYEDFTSKVAEGRGLPLEEVQKIAKGRIWTGEAALELGLVDRLGGYDAAIEEMKTLLELDEDDGINLRVFPREKTFFEALTDEGPRSSEKQAAIAVLQRVVEIARPVVKITDEMGITNQPGVLTMPVQPSAADRR